MAWMTLLAVDDATSIGGIVASALLALIAGYQEFRRRRTDKKVGEIGDKQEKQADMLSSALLIIDCKGVITETCTLMAVWSGYKREELIGNPMSLLIPGPEIPGHHYDRHNFETSFAEAVKTPIEVRLPAKPLTIQRRNGTLLPVWVTVRGWGEGEKSTFQAGVRLRRAD